MKFILIAFFFVALSTAIVHRTEIQEKRLNEQNSNNVWLWYNQTLDHFNPQNTDIFQQRYYDIDVYWNPRSGPLFLYICGEGTCRQPSDDSFVVKLAKKFQGRVLALEHRYYGMSQPMPDWSTENLQFLTPDQGLADLAQFASEKSREYSETYNIPFRRWITVGGSYPGAMSAWFRAKYPHIAFASLASSGVVNAIADYHQYDGQVYNSTLKSGEECPHKYFYVTQMLEEKYQQGLGEQILKDLGYEGDEITEADLLSFIADLGAGSIQYGARTDFCSSLLEAGSSYQDIIEWVKYYADKLGSSLDEYPISYLQNTTIEFDRNMRQWTYQI